MSVRSKQYNSWLYSLVRQHLVREPRRPHAHSKNGSLPAYTVIPSLTDNRPYACTALRHCPRRRVIDPLPWQLQLRTAVVLMSLRSRPRPSRRPARRTVKHQSPRCECRLAPLPAHPWGPDLLTPACTDATVPAACCRVESARSDSLLPLCGVVAVACSGSGGWWGCVGVSAIVVPARWYR